MPEYLPAPTVEQRSPSPWPSMLERAGVLHRKQVRLQFGVFTGCVEVLPAVDGLQMTVDREGVLFVPVGAADGWKLSWDRILAAAIVDSPSSAADAPASPDRPPAIAFHTAHASYLAILTGEDEREDGLFQCLSTQAPPGVVADIRSPHPADQNGEPAWSTANWAATTPQAVWLDLIRPVLIVTLAVAVAVMIALVLAESVGALHLGWLGGTPTTSPTSFVFHR